MQSPEQQAKLMQLKDDPELKDMFEDIQKHGAGDRYAKILLQMIFQCSPADTEMRRAHVELLCAC